MKTNKNTLPHFSYADGDREINTVIVTEYDETYYVDIHNNLYRAISFNGQHDTFEAAEAEANRIATKYNLQARWK